MFQGDIRQVHTVECGERFGHLMNDEGKVHRTRENRKECEEKVEKEMGGGRRRSNGRRRKREM